MQPQTIYSSSPYHGPGHDYKPRKVIAVALGVVLVTIIVVGIGASLNMHQQSGEDSSQKSGQPVNTDSVDGTTKPLNDQKQSSKNHQTSKEDSKNSVQEKRSTKRESTVFDSPSMSMNPGYTDKDTDTKPNTISPNQENNSSLPTSQQPNEVQPTSDACGSYKYKANGSRWTCTFSDDFSGTSLNISKWAVATSPNDFFQFYECYYNRPENVYVGGGYLNLVSRREIPQIGCGWLGGRDFSGGMVRTYKKHSVNRGKIEIRLKIPQSKGKFGIGTSLWMIPVPSGKPGAGDAGWYGAWPASGEIDIAEMYGPYDDYANPSLHYNVKSGHRLQYSCGQENYNTETVTARCNVPGAATGFHTYGVEWTNDTITMLYDGKKVLVDKWNSNQGGPAPFDQDFYLNITQGFANIPIPGPYSAVLPATAQVDYVRIWQ